MTYFVGVEDAVMRERRYNIEEGRKSEGWILKKSIKKTVGC